MVDTDDTRRTTDDGRFTTDDRRRTTQRVWHKLPTGELTIMQTYNYTDQQKYRWTNIQRTNIMLLKYNKYINTMFEILSLNLNQTIYANTTNSYQNNHKI